MSQIISFLLISFFSAILSMDNGASGVYDSPSATDLYVQRFGFMFGGGRSGMYGLHAMQVEKIIIFFILYLKMQQESNDPLHQARLPAVPFLPHGSQFLQRAKHMRELSPLVVEMKKEHKKMKFSRFMAVP